ncbi:hypothetical protein FJ365_05990 [Candidatus Dependentiae bacterium]|nr:hypothetical protein [Candidatus Dependentiae bacterium]
MLSSIAAYWSVLGHMLYADLLTFKPMMKTKLIDVFIYTSITIVVMGYLLTSFGLRPDFGIFTAATLVGSVAMFEIYPRAAGVVMDLTGNKVITYDLTLPLPSWLAITRIGITTALQSLFISLFTLPIGLLFVYNQFDATHFSVMWFILLLIMGNIFFGFFSLFLSSFVQNIQQLGSCWMRIIFPLWTLGGFQFTWAVLFAKSKWLAYLVLLNPCLYAQEGMRSAILGQAENIPCWICFLALACFSALCGWISVKRMMTRLNCV